ncbi:MAG: Crp/Fnr family transcriptional regulator [Bacteroidetes bacterium]|jgi:signal-transduction protein with cAMP-binding, CBS, and nucleotidyltransferase domain|nr:Crp/Fnr family transcriptional regulator [Bacteroidota bacterium]MCA6442071.1 Crp/Fnr family transcriptional regulator [Bacteroidota bacterium]
MQYANYKSQIESAFSPIDFRTLENELITGSIEIKKIRKDSFLLMEGNICNNISFIIDGAFRQFSVVDGTEINFLFYFDNDFTADFSSYITETPSNYFIKALEDSLVITFNKNNFSLLASRNNDWEVVSKNISNRALLTLYKRNDILLTLSPENRYLKLLEVHPLIIHKVSLSKISSFLGISGPSLSRIRKRIISS